MPFGGEVNNGILTDLVGYSGLTEAARDIVHGNFMEKHSAKVNLLPEMEQLIMEMAMPMVIKKMGKIEKEITTTDFEYGFKSWKELTLTSPSG
jgi:hypothetical protein